MFRTPVLLLQMHEGPGQLDESFKKSMGRALLLKPEVFQHIMRFVIFLVIKANEIALVTRVVGRSPAQRLHKCLDLFAFFHSRLL
jgi:hypothetical protein